MVKTALPLLWTGVQPLVWKLRSHKLHDQPSSNLLADLAGRSRVPNFRPLGGGKHLKFADRLQLATCVTLGKSGLPSPMLSFLKLNVLQNSNKNYVKH